MVVDRFSVRDRVVIITGGGRGIGRGLALGFAELGATVVVVGRTASTCDDTVGTIAAAGGTALAVVADVTGAADRQRIVDDTIGAFGRIDVLINNAAVLRPHVTEKVTEAELDEIVAIGLKAPVFLAQAALPHLERSGHGSIVNVSALGAFQPLAGIGAYCAVKAAMVNWTATMAKEWTPRGVRVNALVPGPVATDMILPLDPDRRARFVEEMTDLTLVGRIGQPGDLVGAAVFLASDASAFMTGRSLFVDAGALQ